MPYKLHCVKIASCTDNYNGGCTWQKGDEEIKRIKKDIEEGKSWKYRIEAGVVMTVVDKIWIPEAKSREMIKETHKMLSHAGADKVLHYIGNAYDMTKMKEVVKETISACEACQKNKVVTSTMKEETMELTAKEPFEEIYIDICGPLPKSQRKNMY